MAKPKKAEQATTVVYCGPSPWGRLPKRFRE